MEVEMKIRGLMMDPTTNMPIVVLKDVGSDMVLPIWVGVYEANAIALEIEKVSTPRPMTHDLLKNVLMGLRGAPAQGGGHRPARRHFLCGHLGRAQWRSDQHRLAPFRCAGLGAAHGLSDFCRRIGVAQFQGGRGNLRQGQQRRAAKVARRSK